MYYSNVASWSGKYYWLRFIFDQRLINLAKFVLSSILLKAAKLQLFSLALCCQIKKVTDGAHIVETAE